MLIHYLLYVWVILEASSSLFLFNMREYHSDPGIYTYFCQVIKIDISRSIAILLNFPNFILKSLETSLSILYFMLSI